MGRAKKRYVCGSKSRKICAAQTRPDQSLLGIKFLSRIARRRGVPSRSSSRSWRSVLLSALQPSDTFLRRHNSPTPTSRQSWRQPVGSKPFIPSSMPPSWLQPAYRWCSSQASSKPASRSPRPTSLSSGWDYYKSETPMFRLSILYNLMENSTPRDRRGNRRSISGMGEMKIVGRRKIKLQVGPWYH